MLLAQQGLSVLLVDRVGFPSETISTHIIQLPGVARLKKWGLLDKLVASNAPLIRNMSLDVGDIVLPGSPPAYGDVGAILSPRRTILDPVLIEAAREAGAELREHFTVREIVFDGDRVTGIRGCEKGGELITELAPIVIGADGKHSLVAKAVRAPAYAEHPPLTISAYSYFKTDEFSGGENYGRADRVCGIWPTNDGCVMTYVAWPIAQEKQFRDDVESNFLATVDQMGTAGERIRAAERTERFRVTTDVPNFIRKPFGNGWALPPERANLLASLAGNQQEINRFHGLLAGSVSFDEYFGKDNLARIIPTETASA